MEDSAFPAFTEENSDEENSNKESPFESYIDRDLEIPSGTRESSNEESNFDSPLYEVSEYSLGTVLPAIMTFAMSHKISMSCLSDLLNLLKLILPPPASE